MKARDGRFHLYAPVLQRGSTANDRFAIGVAVADSPRGPWRDAHPAGPIISQTLPVANDIQNIDPTVIVDDDGRVYIYWGTFGQLRPLEPAPDMVTPKGPERTVHGLTGFFEAPWIFKRNGTYYLLYAGNRAGPDSDCTAAVYYACQVYGTAPSPMGPWTYRGVLLRPVSSTTSHAGAVAFKGQWYLAFHTADAKGGGPFPALGGAGPDGVGRYADSRGHPDGDADTRARGRSRAGPQHRARGQRRGIERTGSGTILDQGAERRDRPASAAAARHVGHLGRGQSAATVDRISLARPGHDQRQPPVPVRRPAGGVGQRGGATPPLAPGILEERKEAGARREQLRHRPIPSRRFVSCG